MFKLFKRISTSVLSLSMAFIMAVSCAGGDVYADDAPVINSLDSLAAAYNSGDVSSDGSQFSMIVNSVILSGFSFSVDGNRILIDYIPSDPNIIQNIIKNSVADCVVTYYYMVKWMNVSSYEDIFGAAGFHWASNSFHSDTVGKPVRWNVYSIGPKWYIDFTINASDITSRYPSLPLNGVFAENNSSSLTKTYEVSFKAGEIPTGVSVPTDTLNMKVGQYASVNASVTPFTAFSDKLEYSVNNGNVSVDNYGNVYGIKEGSSVITIREPFSGSVQTVNVNVGIDKTDVMLIDLSDTYIAMNVGDTGSLKATVFPTNATDKSVTWRSSDTSVVTVDQNGQLRAVKAGSACITAASGSNKDIKGVCTVTVRDYPAKITINGSSTVNMTVGEKLSFTTSVEPYDVTPYTVDWSTSNSGVVKVSNGTVTAVKAGTAKINARIIENDLRSPTITIVVRDKEVPVSSVKLNKTSISMTAGDTASLTATVSPTDAANKSVTWTSSNTSVAKVSSGKITAVKAGTATITAKTVNGKTATCKVTVKAAQTVDVSNLEAIIRSGSSKTIYVDLGSTIKLEYDLSDSSVDKNSVPVSWHVNCTVPGCLSIDQNGRLTASAPGSGLVTINIPGGYASTCTVIVRLNEQQIDEKRLEFAQEVLRLCNIEREKEGLKPLELMDDLNFVAQIRADEQTEVGDISHTRPDGTNWKTVLQNVNVPNRARGENLILNYGSAESVVRGWMASPGHRANIMRENFTHMGIGVTFSGDDTYTSSYIVTQIFIEYSGK